MTSRFTVVLRMLALPYHIAALFCLDYVSEVSRFASHKLSLMILERVLEKSTTRTIRRCLSRWKYISKQGARNEEQIFASKQREELQAEYAAAHKLLLQQRESDQLLLQEHSREINDQLARVVRQCEARESEEVAQYKHALMRQRQTVSQITRAWSKQQSETSEMLQLEQQHVADTFLEQSRVMENLESAMTTREAAAQEAELRLREMEGIVSVYQSMNCP